MLLDKIESVCVWKIWMRGNDPIMRRFILAVFSVLIVATNYSYGAPTSATVAPGKSSAKSGAADEAIILAPPISPLDESRIEQALNKLKEQLGKPETSGDDAGFDGEDFPEQQIKSFITNKSDAKTSLDEDDKEATDATTKDSLMFEETHNDDQKTEQASLRDDATDRKELNPFQSLPISYLKESVGDEDHEFFIEDPHRMHHFAGPAFRDVFDETDSEDNFSSNDDLILRSDELFSRRPQKESRSEAAKEDDGSSLVEPELIVPEISDEPNIPNRETVVQEKDVLHIDADDNLLKPKEVHKHVEEPSLTLYTAELTPAVIQEHSTETVSAGSSTSSELKPTPEQAFPSTATAASTSTTSETVTAAPFDPLPAKKRIQSGALDGVILEKDSVIISTVQVPNSKDTAISARPTPTIVPASTSATIERLSDSELINETTRASGTTDGQTARPTKPTTSAPSTVQKIPQFIKQIYEAATHRFPSFIHSGSMTEYSSTQSSVAILNKTESLPSNDEAFDVTSTVFSAAADESSPNVTIGPQRSPVGSTGVPQSSDEENYGQGAGTSEHSTQAVSKARQFAVEVCLFQRLCLQSPSYKEAPTAKSSSWRNGFLWSKEVAKSNSKSESDNDSLITFSSDGDVDTIGTLQFIAPDPQGNDELNDDTDDDYEKDDDVDEAKQDSVVGKKPQTNSPNAGRKKVQAHGGKRDPDDDPDNEERNNNPIKKKVGNTTSNINYTDILASLTQDFFGDQSNDQTAHIIAKPISRLSLYIIPLNKSGSFNNGSHAELRPQTKPIQSLYSTQLGWNQQKLAVLHRLAGPAAPAAAAPAASENASSTTNISETSTLGPMIVQSTTSAPEDSPIGTLVKGRPCEGQVATRLDRIMDHFPARLPELHEFKRRRFLRAAVIGGLHTLRSTQRNVTCNLTSGTTYWGYRLRGQLDGILNLGITGLPRMYLRFTGPLIVRATFSALGSEDRPVLDSVVVEESRVDEIHYQSVLGFEQPFVERATKYLMHRAMKEEVVTPITEAIQDELLSPKADKSKVLLLDDASHH
ncbi:nucleoprotein TPR-like isoform X2 [Varroa jacobsoni]|uniref:nucleoprotein TPR-like isoform X2 n=1 Tax=Varroa jacobsoni TaxID=62625 RepID=UPI000BF3E163|nr:nucleoprotein TPR-like isoform X2 [Varroa jacobsoni]